MDSRFCGDPLCQKCFDRSFASVVLQYFIWHPTFNLPIKPFMVAKGSKKKYYFYHESCKHSFEKTPWEITGGKNKCGCPYCSKTNHHLCGNIDCDSCFKRSLASANMVGLMWHPTKNGDILPHMAFRGMKKYHFKCKKCNHDTFVAGASAVNAVSCQFCGNGKHCGDKLCQICKCHSILSLEMSKYLSSKNDPNVWMLSRSSAVKVIFDCPYCGLEYESQVYCISAGHWCGCRKKQTEAKLFKFLISLLSVTRNVTYEWCKNEKTGKFLPFDFCIDGRILCELDGGHHFKDVNYWKSNVGERQERDIYKMKMALQNNFRVIRLFQEDVWNDKNEWDTKLKMLIEDNTLKLSFVATNNVLVTNTYDLFMRKCVE